MERCSFGWNASFGTVVNVVTGRSIRQQRPSTRFFNVVEITREKLTLRLHQELPYQLTVETENWQERKDGSVRIEQVVYVMRDGHKGIILGNKAETIKAVSMTARRELSEMLERTVHLFLQVKVRQGWLEEAQRYSAMGLDFKDGNA